MASEKIRIDLEANNSDLNRKIDESDKRLGKLNVSVSSLAKGAALGFGALAAAAAGAVKEASKFEDISVQFEVLTGSAEQATKTVKELQNFAASTPFQFEGIADAAQQLLGFGFSVDEITPKLQEIGDVAAASGRPIEELSLIFGQVAAAGKLTGERLLQFQERAIPIGSAIAQTLGVAESAVKDLVSSGKVDFDTFQQAFASLSEKGSFAFEGLIKQSKTLSGLISTTKDNFSLLAAGIGNELLPATKTIVSQLLLFIQNLKDSESFLNLIRNTISFTSKLVINTAEAFDILGSRIGVVTATISESLNAALNLDFKKAIQIFKTNNDSFKAELIAKEQEYAEKIKAIDESLYQKQRETAQKRKDQQIVDNSEKLLLLEEQKNAEFEKELELLEQNQTQLNEAELLLLQNKLERRQKLKDVAAAKELKQQGKTDKALEKLREIRDKDILKRNKQNIENERAFSQAKVNILQATANLATVIGKKGSKEVFLIQKAAALAQAFVATNLAAAQALAVPPSPNFALASLAKTAGAINIGAIAASTIQGFAQGGLATGGVSGVDSIPALLQRGEVVSPRQNFEEVIGSVRAKREADKLMTQGQGQEQSIELELSFKDNIGDFIETTIIERRENGTGII